MINPVLAQPGESLSLLFENMNNEIKLGDIVVFKTGTRAFEVVGKYIVTDDRLWRVEAIDENDPPTPDRNRKYRLVAVDCPNVILENIPERYVESYSEKLEIELEEQRKEALKMNRNEIKQGDKVRVSKDAPRMYVSGHCSFFYGVESVVEEIEDGNAIIRRDDGSVNKTLAIPTKYLIKVDAEAKEAKFKAGDRVRFKNIYELQKVKDKSYLLVKLASKEATIIDVERNGLFYRVDIDPSIGGINDDMIECKVEPIATKFKVGDIIDTPKGKGTVHIALGDYCAVKLDNGEWYVYMKTNIPYAPYTEHTEQAENKPNIGSIKIPVEVDLTDSYWDAYAADLAKEVVLKVANKYNDPKEAAEYAVSVAKAVVEGLKRK